MNLRKLAAEREEATVDKADLFDFYNKNWNSLVEEIVALRVVARGDEDEDPPCDECGANIPDNPNGGLTNKHHEESCSLYDSNED